MTSTTTPLSRSIRFRFLKGICLLLFLSTCLLSTIMAYHVGSMLQESLNSKGTSLATNIAKRNENALLISGSIRLENVLVELITDEEVAYTVIADNQGKILTSQFESINYNWPGLKAILPKLSKDNELPDILAAIHQHGTVREISVPIMLGVDTVGKVTIGLSEARIRGQIVSTVLFVVALNLVTAVILGVALFVGSKKNILDPIVALSQAASSLAAGNLSTKVNIRSTGEIQTLVDTFNQMAENLNKTTVSKKYVDNIIDSMMDTLVVASPDQQIVLANPAARRLLGYEEGELLGQPLAMIFYDDQHQVGDIIETIFAEGFVSNIQTAYRTKAGEQVQMLFAGSLIVDETSISGIACVAIDVTEVEKLKEELLKLDKLESIGLLAGGLAHDFNNLLQGVFGYISLAKAVTDKQTDVYEMLEKAEQALELSKRLTQQLLTFSKGGEPVKKIVALPPIVQESAQFALSGSNVESQFFIEEYLWPVEADSGQLGQVIQNILINAAEAMPQGGVARISMKNITNNNGNIPFLAPGKYVVIAISDSGAGISDDRIGKIFDPYYTTKDKGNGLGLATSFSIVKKHGGIIDVHSECGRGSTFSVYLPATEKSALSVMKAEESLVMGSGSILVMDDDEMIRSIADRMIRKLGYDVDFAKHGEEALEKYTRAMANGQGYDVVILDLTIKGGMGGKETMERLLALDPSITAIVSSGYSDDPVMACYNEYGFKNALAKPFRISELSKILHEVSGS